MVRGLRHASLACACAFALAAVVPCAHALRGARPAQPKTVYNHGPPHAPNLLVIARAASIDVAMRAAGLRRAMVAQEQPTDRAGKDERYTDNPLEVSTHRTRVDPGAQLVPALRVGWSEVGEGGIRTLAAQFAVETGSGSHCYNFNLGNQKGSGKETHMYLRGVWEGLAPHEVRALQSDVAFGPLVRIEADDEARAKGHIVPSGRLLVIVDPPHPVARFRAFDTLQSGADQFVALHRRIAERHPAYMQALRAGEPREVVRLLGSAQIRYYTGNVEAYMQATQNQRAIIDEGLGLLTP